MRLTKINKQALAEFIFTKPNTWQKEVPFSLDIQSESLTSMQNKLADDYTEMTRRPPKENSDAYIELANYAIK